MTEPASAARDEHDLLLSLVVPVYCEEEVIGEFIAVTRRELAKLGVDYEIVFVDDGSTDRTVELIAAEAADDSRLKLVELSYNHGKARAVTAGIQYARGDYLLYMDPDLQDPPDEIGNFLAKAREGYDLVFGVRKEKRDTLANVLLSRAFWFLLDHLTGLDLPRPLAVMRIFSRRFADRFLEYGEANRFIEGMFMHVGMKRTSIAVSQRDRFAGRSKFNLRRKFSLAFDAIFDYSELPLRMATRIGVLLLTASLLSALLVIFLRLFVMEFFLGWPSLFVLITGGFGLQLFFIGIVGKYVGNVYMESKRRPLFSVRELTNL